MFKIANVSRALPRLWLSALLVLACVGAALAQTNSFSYQGRLNDGGAPANGTYQVQFELWDAIAGGTQQPQPVPITITLPNVQVTNGLFAVPSLDFGATAFPGEDRYLEISVRHNAVDPFTTLTPRQQFTSTPYAIRSVSAASATNSTQLGGVDAARFVQSDVDGNVHIVGGLTLGGSFSVDTVNAQTQYNLGGQRILGNAGSGNLFVGGGAGASNSATFNTFLGYLAGNAHTTGGSNVFVGALAGQNNTAGIGNSFFGTSAGLNNTSGGANSFFGQDAGYNNTASGNSFFGAFAGQGNTAGDSNAFFGTFAGNRNVSGTNNSFFGNNAGTNSTGNDNSFFGTSAGVNNTTGGGNSFFGTSAGQNNQNGFFNSFFGRFAGLNNGADFNAFFGAGAGQQNTTGTDNSIFGSSAGGFNVSGSDNSFFGREAGLNSTNSKNSFFGRSAGRATTSGFQNTFAGFETGLLNETGNDNTFFGAYAGRGNTTAVLNAFFGYRAGYNTDLGCCNSFFGNDAGLENRSGRSNSFFGGSTGGVNTTGSFNAFFGDLAGNDLLGTGMGNTSGVQNSFFGYQSGRSNTIGSNNTTIGALSNVGANSLTNASAIGANAFVSASNSMVLGSINGVNGSTASTNVGMGTTSPVTRLHVVGSSWFQGDTTPLPNAAGKGIVIGFSGDLGYISSFDYNSFTPKTLLLNNSGGNVGIGTNAPLTTLQVKTATGVYGFTHTDGAISVGSYVGGGSSGAFGGWLGTVSNHPLYFFINGGQPRITVDTTGNVGVGANEPKAKLDVTGGNILLGSPGQGIILKSPNGATCRLLSIDNAGSLVTALTPCP